LKIKLNFAARSRLSEFCGKLRPVNCLVGRLQMSGLSDAVRVIEPGKTYVGKQGFTYGAGV
jgi:hypothetical protein